MIIATLKKFETSIHVQLMRIARTSWHLKKDQAEELKPELRTVYLQYLNLQL